MPGSSFLLPASSLPSTFLPRFLPPRRSSSASPWIAVVVAGPHLPALERRSSSASPWIAVVVAGPHLPSLERRSSSASPWIAVVVARPHLPALERSGGPCRTRLPALDRSARTGEVRSAVGLAGPQRARFCAPWASPDLNRTSTAINKAI